jgi:peptide/nickel transport system substrate-binding protein
MKKLLFISLVVVLLLSLGIASCKEDTTPTTSAPKPTSTAPAPSTTVPKPTAAPEAPKPTMTATSVPVPVVEKPEGTLKIALTTFSYETFDQIVGESFWGASIYDPIITYDPKGNIIGGACESYSLSPDGNTWTFKVRKGIKWHDGTPLTSADVMFSVQHFSDKASTNPWSPYLSRNLASMNCPDADTFVYVTVNPEPPLVVPFAACYVIPKAYFEKNGQDYFRKHPMGSGPWKYVDNSLKSGEKVEFVANPEHWRVVPQFEKMVQYLIPELSTQIAALKSGEIDIIAGLDTDRFIELRDAGYQLVEVPRPNLNNISFPGTWLTDGPTSDIRVRQAMSYSINRQEICDTYFKGLAYPGGRWFMDEYTYGWDPAWQADPYDLEKAKALLAEANYEAKWKDYEIPINIQVGGTMAVDLMQICASYWAKVGIKTKIIMNDAMVQLGLIFVRGTASAGSVWPWMNFPSAPNTVYHCANMYTSGGVHSTGNDPKADELYKKATTELDSAKALQYWRDFQNFGYDMWVNVSLVRAQTFWVVSQQVESIDGMWIGAWGYAGVKHAK